jgi:hypothetical protein
MMHLEYPPIRRALWLVLVLTLGVVPQNVLGSDRRIPEICKKWPQSRLLIGTALQSRRFVLEAKGEAQRISAPPALGARFVYHRTFGLSLDVAEPIALFYTNTANVCVVERGPQTANLLRIPVFFVGRTGQSLDELKADAQRAAFAPSALLSPGESFGEVRFYLRKGASRFDEIRPFFVCGLPGLMLCEDYCPGDAVAFVETLVSSVVQKAGESPPGNTGASGAAIHRPASPALSPALPFFAPGGLAMLAFVNVAPRSIILPQARPWPFP